MPVSWHSPAEVEHLCEQTKDWLLNTGSLTERLQALTSSFEVDLLGQSLLEMDASEQRLLSPKHHQKWQIREVVLRGANNQNPNKQNAMQHDWVFARSVLPDELCRSTWANLGSQPLGQRIFNDASFVRSEFEIGQLRYHPISREDFSKQDYWARRSKFTIDTFELIVAEAFLPDSPCYWRS